MTSPPRTLLALSLALATPALAQVDPAKAADKSKPAEAVAAPPAEPAKDFTQEAQATLGALFNDGNTSALAGRVGGFWQGRYLAHGLRLDLGAGVASLAQDPEGDPEDGFDVPLFDQKNPMNTTALGRGRYDFFLGADDSLFGAAFAFHDSAANLAARLRGELGYRHFFFQVPKHAFSGEVGLVWTVDNAPFEVTRSDGGDGKLGLGEATAAVWNNTLTANVNEQLGIGFALSFAYDNGAIARRNAIANHDVAASLQLTYKLF